MGRIADAIKRAESERREKLRIGSVASAAVSIEAAPTKLGYRSGLIIPESDSHPAPVADRFPPVVPAATRLESPIPAAAATIQPWDVHPSLVAITDRSGTVAEQYRAVRTWLLSRMTPGERNCLAITSSVPREGKSVTVANLAAILAEVRHMQVLAIDCDLRQGSLGGLFRLPPGPGAADVIAGRAKLSEALAKTPLGNLSILPAGSVDQANPTELLNSKAVSRLFDEIRESYQYVLVDTPPVQRLSDVGVIGALCTGVVMVVRMHNTATHLVRQSVRWLQSNNLNVVGCIAAACRSNADRSTGAGEDRDE